MSLANVVLCGLLLSATPVAQRAAATGTMELRRYMESSDPGTRAYAAIEYYHLGKETRRLTKEEIDILLAHLKSDSEPDVKLKVTLALPYAENTDWVVGPLIAALKDRDDVSSGGGNVPAYAAVALAKTGDTRALKPMREWLEYIESNPSVYRERRQSLIVATNKAISELSTNIGKSKKAERKVREQGQAAKPNLTITKAVAKIHELHGLVAVAGPDQPGQIGQITMIDLRYTKVRDADLDLLKDMQQLQILSLGSTDITDTGLEHMDGLTQLRRLDLEKTKVTDAGLRHLGGMVRLEILGLSATKITDAGLEHLKELTQLKHLNVKGTSVTDQGVKRLHEALPKCTIAR